MDKKQVLELLRDLLWNANIDRYVEYEELMENIKIALEREVEHAAAQCKP